MSVQTDYNDDIDKTMIIVIAIVASVLVAMAWLPESPTPASTPEAGKAIQTAQ